MFFRKRNRRAVKSATGAETASWTPEQRQWVLKCVAFAVLAIGLVWSVLALLDRPVRRVEVTGHFLRVSPLQIEQAVMAFTKDEAHVDRGFVSLPLDELKLMIEEIAWVDRVRIERRWPDGVRVSITEQIPGARWGERGLLNARGELFLKEARFVPPELPQLEGPDGTESQVARLYLDTYPRLAGVGLRLARVKLDARGAWELTVTSSQATAGSNGGIVIRLGRQDVDARLQRFVVAASPLVSARAGEIRYVDMRYSNGFAVGWIDAASMAGTPVAPPVGPNT
jgi:cell division protein FtsQ